MLLLFANYIYRYEEEISRLRLQLDQMQHGGYTTQAETMKAPPPPPLISSGSPLVNVPHFGPPPIQQVAPPNNVRMNKVPPPPVINNAISFNDLDPESVPANMKVEGQDWFAL